MMHSAEKMVMMIMAEIPKHFKTFGGGVVRNPDNPISHWTKDEPLQFEAGVDVRDVVETVAGMALMYTLEHLQKDIKNGSEAD